jgi:hypothetical protein
MSRKATANHCAVNGFVAVRMKNAPDFRSLNAFSFDQLFCDGEAHQASAAQAATPSGEAAA